MNIRTILTILFFVSTFILIKAEPCNRGEALIRECIALSDKFDYSTMRNRAEDLIQAGEQKAQSLTHLETLDRQ